MLNISGAKSIADDKRELWIFRFSKVVSRNVFSEFFFIPRSKFCFERFTTGTEVTFAHQIWKYIFPNMQLIVENVVPFRNTLRLLTFPILFKFIYHLVKKENVLNLVKEVFLGTSHELVFHELGWSTLSEWRKYCKFQDATESPEDKNLSLDCLKQQIYSTVQI